MVADITFWLPLAILLPLLAAIGAFLVPRQSFRFALIGTVATAAVVAGLTGRLWQQREVARHTIGGWGAPLGIDLVLDGLSMLMLLLTAVIGLAITSYAHGYFLPSNNSSESWHQYNYFWPLWLFLWAALNALFLSGDLFNLYVTLELMGFSAVALTALVRKPAVLKAAMRYLLVSLSGSLMYLLGVVFLYAGYGTLDIALLGTAATNTPELVAAAALITVGLVMKTALFPFHFWLPPAHANAAAPVSALLSALVVKGSFYILLRVWLVVLYPLADTFIPQLLSGLGMAAIIWGSLQAMRQLQLKMLVAYSTVAQLGYLFLLIPLLVRNRGADTAALAGIVIFLSAHALAKAAAFLSAGNLLHAVGEDRLSALDGLTRKMPLTLAAFGVAGVSLTALPPSGGFMAKWLMLNAALEHGYWWLMIVIIGGGLMAAVYIMRVMSHLFFEARGPKLGIKRVPICMSWPPFGLAVLAIMLAFTGVFVADMLLIGTPGLLEVIP
jgi:multicomponent Na+:H+ antiporter subunit D